MDHRRHRELALAPLESRQRDLASGPDRAVLLEGAPDAAGVLAHLVEVPHPHRRAPRRGHPDDPLADPHLRADARLRVAMARDRVETRALLVEQEEQRVLEAEQLRQPVERCLDEGVEIGTPAQAGAQLPERDRVAARTLDARRGAFQRRVLLDPHHAVHVGRAELEDVLHPRERRDRLDVTGEAVEHRAPTLRALVPQLQAVLLVARRDDHHARPRILGQVARGLREELVRQGDVLVVDVMDLGEMGDVRCAVGGRGRDDGRDRALEAQPQVAKRQLAHATPPPMREPARGPGVWL